MAPGSIELKGDCSVKMILFVNILKYLTEENYRP